MKNKISFFTIIALASLAYAQTPPAQKIPTQTEIVREGSKKYFPSLKNSIYDNILKLTGLNDFSKYEKLHKSSPENSMFNLFKANAYRTKPSHDWSLPFYNSRSDMRDVLQVEFGVCAGFSVALRKLNMMAYYDVNNTTKQTIPEKGTPGWLDFYKAKIDNIFENKMTIIPGYNNLYEFASTRELQPHIKNHIVKQWEITNVNILQGTFGGMMAVKKKPKLKELQKIRTQLEARVNYGYNPIVFLSKYNDEFLNSKKWQEAITKEYKDFKSSMKTVVKKDFKLSGEEKAQYATFKANVQEKWNTDMRDQWIHVLQIYEVSPLNNDGSFYIKAWDINEHAETADKRITVTKDAKISMNYDYMVKGDKIIMHGIEMENTPRMLEQLEENANELNAIVPLLWDDIEIEHMIKTNVDFCKKNNCTQLTNN